jgi:DHA3 family macrolide efflux protein-like MFS transporter
LIVAKELFFDGIMSYLKQRLVVFRHPGFSLFLIGVLGATIGNGLSYVVVAWLVVSHFKTMGATALLALCFWLPNTVLSPLIGVWTDRLPSKWFMLASCASRSLFLFFFAWYSLHHSPMGSLFLFNFVMGTLFCLYWPAATKFVRRLVPKNQLMYANATVDMALEIGNVIGMASAGFILATFSAETAFAINGAFFLLTTGCIMLVKEHCLTDEQESIGTGNSVLADFKEGLHYIFAHKNLALIYCVQLIIFCQFMLSPVILAPFAKFSLHLSALQFGEIEASLSAGVILGGILTPWLVVRFNMYLVLLLWSSILMICFAVFGYSVDALMAKILYFFIGICLSTWPILTTRIQELTDLTVQARVQSSFNSISGLIILFIYIFIYCSGNTHNTRALYWLQSAFSFISLMLVLVNKSILKKSRES